MSLALATVADVMARAAMPDHELNTRLVASILAGVTPALESDLRMQFDFGARVDLFFVPDSRREGGRWYQQMRLSGMLVDEVDVALSVLSAPTAEAFEPGYSGPDPIDLRAPPTAVDPSSYVRLDAAAGLLVVQDYRLTNQYVRASYESGFEPDPNKPTQYLLSGPRSVPKWLQELAVLHALQELDLTPNAGGSQSAARGYGAPAERMRRRSDLIEGRKAALLDRHMRYHPGALRPL